MKTSDYIRNAVYALITLVLTFAFGVLTNISFKPKGCYSIDIMQIDTNTNGILHIKNLTKQTQQNLMFLIEGTSNCRINSNSYVEYKLNKSSGDSSSFLLTINNILPKKDIILTLSNIKFGSNITFANVKELRYKTIDSLATLQINATRIVLFNALLCTIVAFIVMTLLSHYYDNKAKERIKEIQDVLKNYKNASDIMERTLDNVEKKMEEYKSYLHKHNLIAGAKIRDYKKENEFWKTLITKEILKDSQLNPKEIFSKVTQSLKTYSTLEKDDDMDFAEYLQRILKEDTKSLSED